MEGTQFDIAWLRSWMAEAVRRAVARGADLWEETQAAKANEEFDEAADIQRWVEAIDYAGLKTELLLLNGKPSSLALEHIGQAMREISCVAGMQLRHTLDGTSLHDLVPSEEWADGYWHKGTLTIPADPVAVLRLVDARLRTLIELLRDIDVAIPGAEAYLEEAEARLAEQREVEIVAGGDELIALGSWERDPDRDQRQRFRVRRRGGSLQIELQRETSDAWIELGAIPAAGATSVATMIKSIRQGNEAVENTGAG